eukprot:jgi/Mesvir1/15258/Mv06478-RA.1
MEASKTQTPLSTAHDLENADNDQLKAVAHSLLDSKFEKIFSGVGTGASDPGKTRRNAVDWLKKWDTDGDGIISRLEMKGAAMEHAKLQLDNKRRGMYLTGLIILAVCCFAIILGISVWANDVTNEADVESRGDLGGFTLREKGSAAVVKTGTALYEFRLTRIGFLPFDELSMIQSISFLQQRSLRSMQVEGFQWLGSGNVTFFSPLGESLSVVKPTANTVQITFNDPVDGDGSPIVLYAGLEDDIIFEQLTNDTIDAVAAQGLPLTVANVMAFARATFLKQVIENTLPLQCAEPALAFVGGNMTALHGTCAAAALASFQSGGVIEAAVGPQDYYGTKLTRQESDGLKGHQFYLIGKGNVFDADPVRFLTDYEEYVASQIKARS